MAFKRALVVDDSRTARQSLAKLLAQYDLEVAFAETGEEALAFLHHELVDVIFMDHTMPGMDGLEAVSAIKGNPRTATIPVMMYTTKEGEVYVSQARALGAVGVLPKQVQPGVLFDMLNKLGLVTDRRNGEPALDLPEPPRRRLTDLADDVDREYEQRALGVSVQTQVTRLLEEQHLKLRADILATQRRYAREVAQEILGQRPSEPAGDDDTSSTRRWRRHLPTALATATAVLAAALVSLAMFTWHVTAARDAARLEIARMTTSSRNELDALSQRNDGLATAMRDQHQATRNRLQHAMASLEWALNQSNLVPFGELPFGDTAADQLTELLARLQILGFQGRLLLTAQLAPFCLSRNAAGVLTLADPEAPTDECEVNGHPMQDAGSVTALQSVGFATALSEAARLDGITVDLAVRSPGETGAYLPSNVDLAAEWNRQAAQLNRIETTLTPALGETIAAARPTP